MQTKTFVRLTLYSILCVFTLFYLTPIMVMLMTSIKPLDEIRSGNIISIPQEFTTYGWSQALFKACIGVACKGIYNNIVNSIKMVIPSVIISTLLGAFTGFVLTHWKFKGSNLFFGLLLMGCFIPFQLVILPMTRTLAILGMFNTIAGLALVHIIYGVAFTTLFFRNYYVSFPHELIESGKIDGASFIRIFFSIIIPLSRPIIVVSIIWQFTQIWNDFLFGLVFSSGESQPVMVALNNLVNTSTSVKEYNVDMAAALIAALPTLLVYIFAGKYFVRGLTEGAVKG